MGDFRQKPYTMKQHRVASLDCRFNKRLVGYA